jgi:hypothetical protein
VARLQHVRWSHEEDAKAIAAQAADEVFGAQHPEWFSIVIRNGSPARQLLDERDGAEMLVVGSRGLGGFTGPAARVREFRVRRARDGAGSRRASPTGSDTEMKAMIIYESMFGNTREVAEAIAEGLGANTDATVVPVWSASVSSADLDLLIVGAPTHAHSLSRPASRVEAGQWAEDTTKDLRLEPNAEGMGVREWLESCVAVPPRFAAFDTRADIARVLSGSAAGKIEKRLRRLGSSSFSVSQSYRVDSHSRLEPGELDRARQWGHNLGLRLAASRDDET